MGEDGPGKGYLCHTGTFLVLPYTSAFCYFYVLSGILVAFRYFGAFRYLYGPKYFLPKIPKYHFVGVCDETYQKVRGHYNLHGELGVYFKIMRKMLFSLKPKDPFP